MALRFRRSIRLAPGIRLNFGKRSLSLSTGVRGASVTFGSRGTFANLGIPGTGLSVRERIGGSARKARRTAGKRRSARREKKVEVVIDLKEDGTLEYRTPAGELLEESLIPLARQQNRDGIRNWLAEARDRINQQVRQLETLHLATPSPNRKPVFHETSFTQPEPEEPEYESLGLWGRLFGRVRRRIETDNQKRRKEYEQRLAAWQKDKAGFESRQREMKRIIEHGIYSDPEAMDRLLDWKLAGIEWPRETLVSYQVDDSGKQVCMDVDLPEIEDMPDKTASLPARGWKLGMKPFSDTRKRRLYMVHVHGIGFRLIGEVFASLPTVDRVILSAYSQRINRATGHEEDQYLYSVMVERVAWSGINFDNLDELDIVAALGRFTMRRKMSKTGIFKPVEPFVCPGS